MEDKTGFDHIAHLENELAQATNETHIRLLKETIAELKELEKQNMEEWT